MSKYDSSWELSQGPLTLTRWSDLKNLLSLVYDEWARDGLAWEMTSQRQSQFLGSGDPPCGRIKQSIATFLLHLLTVLRLLGQAPVSLDQNLNFMSVLC